MRLKKAVVGLAVLVVVLAGGALAAWQASQPRVRTATFDPPYPATDASGVPILGVYEGRIPCPSEICERLKVQVVLYGSEAAAPRSYWLAMVGAAGNDRVVSVGAVNTRRGVVGYPEALAYVLDDNAGDGLGAFWRVSDDILLPLDGALVPKPGNGAWGTMLSRYDAPYGPRTYIWVN